MKITGSNKKGVYCLIFKGEDIFFDSWGVKSVFGGKYSIDLYLENKIKNLYLDFADGSMISGMLKKLENTI